MEFRRASVRDIDSMITMRKRQLVDEGLAPELDIDDELLKYFTARLQDHSLVQWLAEDQGAIVATAAIVFFAFPPSYVNKTGVKGYVTNMYTAPMYRGRGIAAQMLRRLTDEAQARGVRRILLAASEMGKPVYKKFGFEQADEWMELIL